MCSYKIGYRVTIIVIAAFVPCMQRSTEHTSGSSNTTAGSPQIVRLRASFQQHATCFARIAQTVRIPVDHTAIIRFR